MRGIDQHQADMFSYLSSEQWVRKDHPLRAVWVMTGEILEAMSPLFDAMYAEGGRPSIPPEKLLRAQLLQMLYSVRSERDAASFHRHVSACPHGNTYISLRQRGRIVHRVAGHRDNGAHLLTLLYDLRLLLRRHIRMELDAEFVRYRLGGGLVISRDHNICSSPTKELTWR